MHLIDHNNEIWRKRIRRTNGAYTYSQDLVKYQIPHWEKILGDDDLISTCPKISEIGITGNYNFIFQYLHSFPYANSIYRTQLVKNCSRYSARKIVFISAYKNFVINIRAAGMKAIFAPMGIDVEDIQKYKQEQIYDDRIIYFGNVIQNKVHLFNKLKQICPDKGLKFDYISNDRFNNKEILTREEILKRVSRYKYAIAVGRCAQEAMALGVKTVIAGHKFGGLITNDEEYQQQLETNMNGRIMTYTHHPEKAIKDIDKAILRPHDITKENHAELFLRSKL